MVYNDFEDWLLTPEERSRRMRNAQLGMGSVPMPNFPGFGTAESNYGSAPYQEASQRARARLGLQDRLLAALSGLGSIRPGAGFGESFLASLGGSARATWAAKQAAMNYAQRQYDQETARQNAETQRMLAEANAKEKPAPPPKPEKLEPWQLPPEEYNKYLKYEADLAKARAAGRPAPVAKGAIAKAPKPAAPPKPATGAERQSLAYYNRMKDAEAEIQKLESTIAKQNPLDQLRLQSAPNYLQTETQQLYRQAQRAFTEARLRKESGAAIPQQEYDNDARTYFAQPGDKPETVKRKRAARQAVLNGLKFSSGKAYGEFYGAGADSSSSSKANDPLGVR